MEPVKTLSIDIERKLISESGMKIKKKLVLIVIREGYSKIRSNTKYPTSKKDESRFIFLILSLRLVQDPGLNWLHLEISGQLPFNDDFLLIYRDILSIDEFFHNSAHHFT